MSRQSVFKALAARMSGPALRSLLAVTLVMPLFFFFTPAPTAQAASAGSRIVADPPGPGTGAGSASTDPALDDFEARLLELARTVIKLIIFIGVIVLTIAVPKGALMAQVNNLFGSANGVSHAWINILSAIVAGGLLLMSMPLVDLILKLFVPTGSINVHIPVPGF